MSMLLTILVSVVMIGMAVVTYYVNVYGKKTESSVYGLSMLDVPPKYVAYVENNVTHSRQYAEFVAKSDSDFNLSLLEFESSQSMRELLLDREKQGHPDKESIG